MSDLQDQPIPKAGVDQAVRTRDSPLTKILKVSLFNNVLKGWISNESGQ